MDQHSNLNFVGGAKVTNLPAASAAGEPVVYEQMNSMVEGLAWKDSVRVASTANLTLTAPGATIDGITMAANDRFLAKDQTTQSQNGIYIWNGAATPATRAVDASTFAELEAAVVSVEEGTANIGATFRQTQVNGVIDTNNVIWVTFGASVPASSETISGTIEIATQAEVNTGADDVRAVTALKLANYSGRIKEFVADVGDGSATSFNIDHNLNNRDVMVQVRRNSGNYDTIQVDTQRTTVNRVVVGPFSVAPAAAAFRVIIHGRQQ